jgi:hypothetical protein
MSQPRERPDAVAWAGVSVYTACAILLCLVELFLVPLYIGSIPIPVAVLLAIVGNVVLPVLSRSLVHRALGAVLPFLGWLIPLIAVGVLGRPEGDVVLPGAGSAEWVAYGVMLGGAAAGAVTLVMTGMAPPAVAPQDPPKPAPGSGPKPGPQPKRVSR